MIVPCPETPQNVLKFPLTITLTVLNIFIFFLVFSGAPSFFPNAGIFSEQGLLTTGRLYYQYLKEQPPHELLEKPEWMHKMSSQNRDHLVVIGSYALRDARFMESAESLPFWGDAVQIATWKKDFVEFRRSYQDQVLYRFGLSSLAKGPWAWVTYQFSHSNWLHLFSNLVFLVLMGAAVEGLAGSGMLLFIYIVGGIAGGAGFLMSQAHGTVPMVGASASVSALMAFYCFAERRARIRYFFFISPAQSHHGAIYLPTLLIFPLYLLVDLASFWGTPEGLGGGVAYAAHLGGAALGIVTALIYRQIRRPLLLTES